MDQLLLASILANSTSSTGTKSGFLADDLFLRKLRNILQNEWNHHIVSWLPEGKIWRVHDLAAFQTKILSQFPVIQDHQSPLDLFLAYTTFKGFQEISRGLNSIAFYHQVSFCPRVNCDSSILLCSLHFLIIWQLTTIKRDSPGILSQRNVPKHCRSTARNSLA